MNTSLLRVSRQNRLIQYAFGFVAVLGEVSCGGGGSTSIVPPASAVALRMLAPLPASVVAGTPFSVSVEVIDGRGTRVTSASNLVTLVLGSGPTGAALAGITQVAASAGVATFSNLTITTAGAGFTITAGASGLTAATSSVLTIVASAVNAQQTLAFLSPTSIGPGQSTQLSVVSRDQFGNPVALVPVALANNPSTDATSLTFSPQNGVTDILGSFKSTVTAAAGATSGHLISVSIAGGVFTLNASLSISSNCARRQPLALPGLVNGSLSTTACLGGAYDRRIAGDYFDYYTLTVGQPAVAKLTLTATGFSPTLSVLHDPSSGTFLLNSPGNTSFYGNFLLPAGALVAEVSSDLSSPVGSTGSYTLQTEAIDPRTVSACIPTVVPASVNSGTLLSLTGTHCSDSGGGGVHYYDEFLVYSRAPCTITMRSTAFDAYLKVYDAANTTLLGQDDNSGGGTDAKMVLPACLAATGYLRIRATTVAPSVVGAYTLEISMIGSANAVNMVEGPKRLTFWQP